MRIPGVRVRSRPGLRMFFYLPFEHSEDILLLLRGIEGSRAYPDTLGYKVQFDRLVRDWRPHLIKE